MHSVTVLYRQKLDLWQISVPVKYGIRMLPYTFKKIAILEITEDKTHQLNMFLLNITNQCDLSSETAQKPR